MIESLQYPIGRFTYNPDDFEHHFFDKVMEIESFPMKLNSEVSQMSESFLDTPYRPEGWTVRQVVHHLADSHAQCLIRFKWALTEESPLIKTYHEASWAELPDSANGPIEPSLYMLQGVHHRWAYLLKQMSPEDWSKSFFHPEKNRLVGLKETLFLYAWHGQHHLMHIINLKSRLAK